MDAVDPRDPAAVAEVLRRRAADRWGDAVTLAETPSSVGAGFDSYIHLVRLRGAALPDEWGAPLVVRLLPSRDREAQAHREAEAQAWSESVGYRAPRVLEVLGVDEGFGLPAQVMERAPGTTMLDALTARPWRAFAFVEHLARLQLELHALPTDGWPGTRDPRALADQRLSLPRRAATELGDAALGTALERVEAVVADGLTGDLVVCHGDFHPLNVLVDGAEASVIEWTDAGLGPREADVARTLPSVPGGLDRGHELGRARGAQAGRAAARPSLPPGLRAGARARCPPDVGVGGAHAIHGWSQILTLHAGGFDGASRSAGDEQRAPLEVGDWLRARVDQALADLG